MRGQPGSWAAQSVVSTSRRITPAISLLIKLLPASLTSRVTSSCARGAGGLCGRKLLEHLGQSFINFFGQFLGIGADRVGCRASPDKLLRFGISQVNDQLTSYDSLNL